MRSHPIDKITENTILYGMVLFDTMFIIGLARFEVRHGKTNV